MNFEEYTTPVCEDLIRIKHIVKLAFGGERFFKGDADDTESGPINKPLFYLRGFYAAMFITEVSNHLVLTAQSTFYIDRLFRNIYDTLQAGGHNCHYPTILHVISFYMNIEPNIFCYNFIKYRLGHHLLFNIDKIEAQEFMIALLNPNDSIKGLPSFQQTLIWRDFGESGLYQDLAHVTLKGREAINENKFDKNNTNADITESLSLLNNRSAENHPSPYYELLLFEPSLGILVEDALGLNKIDIDRILNDQCIPIDKGEIFSKRTSSFYESPLRTRKSLAIKTRSGMKYIANEISKFSMSRLPTIDLHLSNHVKTKETPKPLIKDSKSLPRSISSKRLTFEDKKAILLNRGRIRHFSNPRPNSRLSSSSKQRHSSSDSDSISEVRVKDMRKNHPNRGRNYTVGCCIYC